MSFAAATLLQAVQVLLRPAVHLPQPQISNEVVLLHPDRAPSRRSPNLPPCVRIQQNRHLAIVMEVFALLRLLSLEWQLLQSQAHPIILEMFPWIVFLAAMT